jgi:hypothetical protein
MSISNGIMGVSAPLKVENEVENEVKNKVVRRLVVIAVAID